MKQLLDATESSLQISKEKEEMNKEIADLKTQIGVLTDGAAAARAEEKK